MSSKYFHNQKEFDVSVTEERKVLVSICKDEPYGGKSKPYLLVRKFWFRMKLYSLYKLKKFERNFGVLFMGSGGDTLGNNLTNWNVVRIDKEKFEGVIQMDLNNPSECEKLGDIVRENNIQLIVMEGLTYYLNKEVLEYIFDLAKRRCMYLLLDGFDERGVELSKQILKFKTPLPLDLLPKKCEVVTTEDLAKVFGTHIVNTMESKAYFVSNF